MSDQCVELVVSLNLEEMLRYVRGEEKYDIYEHIKDVPGLQYLHGDKCIAVSVKLPLVEEGSLRERVAGKCTVDVDRFFKTHI
jgi:hypothetical protein